MNNKYQNNELETKKSNTHKEEKPIIMEGVIFVALFFLLFVILT